MNVSTGTEYNRSGASFTYIWVFFYCKLSNLKN